MSSLERLEKREEKLAKKEEKIKEEDLILNGDSYDRAVMLLHTSRLVSTIQLFVNNRFKRQLQDLELRYIPTYEKIRGERVATGIAVHLEWDKDVLRSGTILIAKKCNVKVDANGKMKFGTNEVSHDGVLFGKKTLSPKDRDSDSVQKAIAKMILHASTRIVEGNTFKGFECIPDFAKTKNFNRGGWFDFGDK